MGRLRLLRLAMVAFLTLFGSLAFAAETITYTYDALGRLVTVVHSGTVNNGVSATYTYDAADNRSNVTVTGGSSAPSFSIGNATAVTEGGNAVFTVTKAGTTGATLTVNYTTANGTATAGSDYTSASNLVLTFLPTDTSQTITIATTDDAAVESPETFTVTLSNPSGGSTITTATGTGTINDNDAAAPSFSIGNATAVTEGGNAVFTVTKAGTTGATLTVNYTTANGTATAGSDYTSASNLLLTFQPTDASKTITIATTDDAAIESPETFTVTLSNPSGGSTITTSQGSGTINDNDATSFAIANASAVTEGGTLVYTVTKTGSGAANVNFATANGSAASGSDYNSNSGTLTFAAGDTSKTINVTTIDDAAVESAETVLVNLSGATGGATITTSQGSGTINDNDVAAPSFAIGNATAVGEGGTLVYTVTKTGAGAANVNFATASGSATSGSDFTANSGTLTFASGDTTKTISVVTIDDATQESAETVLVNLSGATGGATITTSQGSGTINANDSYITLTNNYLAVLSAHQSTYTCYTNNIPELSYFEEGCSTAGGTVYYAIYDGIGLYYYPGYSDSYYAPGYGGAMGSGPLIVESGYYNTP